MSEAQSRRTPMKKSLIETRFRQPSGRLLVIVIILFLLLLDQGFGISSVTSDHQHGGSGEKLPDGALSRRSTEGLHEGRRARSAGDLCRADNEHSGDARRRRSVHRRRQQRAR